MSSNDQILSPKRPRRNISLVYAYFTIRDNRYHCNSDNCTSSYAISGTTSMAYHLTKHGIALKSENEESSSSEDDNVSKIAKLPRTSSSTSTTSNPQKHSDHNQKKITDKLINFIVADYQAFNLVLSDEFIEYSKLLDPKYIVPDSHSIRFYVKQKYDSVKPEIIKILKTSESMKSLTSDGWSSNQLDPFLALTAHFIDKNFNYWNVLLDQPEFPHSHDHNHISSEIIDVSLILFKRREMQKFNLFRFHLF